MRIMGLDIGTKRIGVAISDELGLTAQGITTLPRAAARGAWGALRRLATEHGVSRIVVGLPLNMSGTEGPAAEAVRVFGDGAALALKLPVEYWDERLTTVSAQRVLLEGNLSRKKRREVIDQVAATIILQSYLDAHPRQRHERDAEP